MTNVRPLLVVAGALTDDRGRVLVQRPSRGIWAGSWEFPGGKIEAGETPEAALVRELREELDVAVEVGALRPVNFASASLPDRHLILLLYRVRRWAGEPRPLCAAEIAWHHPGALANLPMLEPDQPLAAALVAATPEG